MARTLEQLDSDHTQRIKALEKMVGSFRDDLGEVIATVASNTQTIGHLLTAMDALTRHYEENVPGTPI